MTGRRKHAVAPDIQATSDESPDGVYYPPQSHDDLMRAVVQNAPVVLFALDPSGTMIFAEGAPNRTGLGVPDVVGRSIYDIAAETPREMIDAVMQYVLGGASTTMTTTLNGVTFDVRLSPSRDADGVVTGILGVLHDITERVAAEESLRRRNAYLAALHGVTLGLVNRLDIHDLLHTIVAQAAQLHGTEHGYLYLLDGDVMVLSYGSGIFSDYMGYRLVKGEGVAGQVWTRGEPLVVDDYDAWSGRTPQFPMNVVRSVVGVPLHSGGEIAGVLGVSYHREEHAFTDDEVQLLGEFGRLASIALDNARLYSEAQTELAERKRTEAALRNSEERYRTIIESIEDGYYETDLRGSLIFINDALARILGAPRDAVLGRRFTGFSDEDEGERVAQALNNVRLTGVPVRALDASIRRPNGALRYLEVSVSVIRGTDDEPIGYRGIARDVTDRKQIEQALQASEERYRSVIGALAEGVILFDAGGNVVASNEAAQRIMRLSGDEMAGKHLSVLAPHTIREDSKPYPAEDYPVSLALRTGHAQANAIMGLEFGEDDVTWISINTQPMFRDGEVTPYAAVVSFSDITESKRHALALARSEARNTTLLDAIPDMMFVVTRDGRYVEFKAENPEMLNLPMDKIIGATVHETPLAQISPDAIMAYLDYAIETREVQAFEYMVERDGIVESYEGRMAALNGDEVLVILRDMTDRHQAIMELSKRINQLATLQVVDDELTLSLDIDYVLQVALNAMRDASEADEAFIALWGADDVRLAKVTDGYRLAVGDVLPDEPIFKHVLETGEPMIAEDTRAQMVFPLVSHDALLGLVNFESAQDGTFTDEAFEFLELLISRVAVALDNAKLYHKTQSQLEEVKALYDQVSDLEQLKTQMIRVAAHDLRSPLGVITGYLSMLEEEFGEHAPLYTPYTKPMQRAIVRMQQMATDILSLERIHAAQTQDWERVNLRDLVSRALLDFRDQATARKQLLTSSLTPGAVVMHGDAVQLYEAVSNLIGNALKYTPDGGRISVRLQAVDGAARFEVQDTGIGVPEQFQTSLFTPFYRVKNEETRQIDGTGLGLYLVKSIIERHGGTMRFQSVHGKGSTFGFDLPVRTERAES